MAIIDLFGRIAFSNVGLLTNIADKYSPPPPQKGSVPWNKGIKTGVIPWNKGKKYTYEDIMGYEAASKVKEKQSLSHKSKNGKPPNLKGRKKSKEWREKRRLYYENNPLEPMSQEMRSRISNSLLGNIPWNKGKKLPAQTMEANLKRSESMKKYYASKKENSTPDE